MITNETTTKMINAWVASILDSLKPLFSKT